MGFDWSWENTLGVIGAPFTFGLSLLPTAFEAGNAIFGSEGDAQKALIAQQQQLAREARARRQQVQQQNMNTLGQSVLAFNPRNRMMAQMFGPEAAFSPTEFAQMVQNPQELPNIDPSIDTTSADPAVRAEIERVMADRELFRRGEEHRRQILGGLASPGPGPAPLQPRTPAPPRRY